MAKSAKPVKADIIRQYLALYRDMGGSELARKLSEDFPDYKFSPSDVSYVKTADKKKVEEGVPPAATAPLKTNNNDALVEALRCLKKAKDYFGSDKAKQVLDLL